MPFHRAWKMNVSPKSTMYKPNRCRHHRNAYYCQGIPAQMCDALSCTKILNQSRRFKWHHGSGSINPIFISNQMSAYFIILVQIYEKLSWVKPVIKGIACQMAQMTLIVKANRSHIQWQSKFTKICLVQVYTVVTPTKICDGRMEPVMDCT